jgi:hypothetical protein
MLHRRNLVFRFMEENYYYTGIAFRQENNKENTQVVYV